MLIVELFAKNMQIYIKKTIFMHRCVRYLFKISENFSLQFEKSLTLVNI